MVPFAGYDMPVQYPTGIIAEHKWTREHAGLFDVSHMGPSVLELDDTSGDAAADHHSVAHVIEQLCCGDLVGLRPGQLRYTLLLNQQGGVLDDLMVGRGQFGGQLYIIVNAGTKDADFAMIEEIASHSPGRLAVLTRLDDHALLALQGPEAIGVMERQVSAVGELGFMEFECFDWRDTKLRISRSGYTGEDGFEILVPPSHGAAFWDELLKDDRVKPVGLGARDSLRLEAGLPLYGHDLDETTSPIEADLGFTVSKRRREAANFPGASRIIGERTNGPARKRVGLLIEGAPAREGAEILDGSGTRIGVITSGGFAPSLNRPIAMGYVPPAHAAPGTSLQVSARGRTQQATVAALPFVPHRYVRKAS
jgi:aminomethyltransferase